MQKGIAHAQLVLLTAIVGLLCALALIVRGYLSGVEERAYERGRAEVQAKWDTKKIEDAREAAAQKAAVERAILDEQRKRATAERHAQAYEAWWKEATNEAKRNRVALGACAADGRPAQPNGAVGDAQAQGEGLRAEAPPGGDRAGDHRSDSVRVTWEFVRRFDGLWTNPEGEPVSGLAPGPDWAERAGTPSPYDLEAVAEAASENARRCSRDRREFAALIARIERASETMEQSW